MRPASPAATIAVAATLASGASPDHPRQGRRAEAQAATMPVRRDRCQPSAL